MRELRFDYRPGKLWTPVRTKPRREKKLLEFCNAKNITCYLPLLRRMHSYGKRIAEFDVPMFPGYLFCCIDDSDYQMVLTSHAVLFRIKVSEQEQAGLIEQLKSVREVEKMSAIGEVVVKSELVPGSMIRVKNGPLAGTCGVVTSRKDKLTLSVNIELLGQSVCAEISASDIEED